MRATSTRWVIQRTGGSLWPETLVGIGFPPGGLPTVYKFDVEPEHPLTYSSRGIALATVDRMPPELRRRCEPVEVET